MISGIYKITSPSGKIYIGSSINITERIKHYRSKDCKGQRKLYNSINKHGWDNHILEIVEECSINILFERERYYGELFNVISDTGLNLALPAVGDLKILISEETRLKKSESTKGEKNPFYGRKHSKESMSKRKQTMGIYTLTDEHKKKVSENHAKANSKIVIDLNTGVFYNSCKEAAEYNNLKHTTLKSMLNGTNKNRTNLIYC